LDKKIMAVLFDRGYLPTTSTIRMYPTDYSVSRSISKPNETRPLGEFQMVRYH